MDKESTQTHSVKKYKIDKIHVLKFKYPTRNEN